MPGMMDTILNLGLNDEVVAGLAAKSGERFAYDSYRRFLDMFGGVVSGLLSIMLTRSASRLSLLSHVGNTRSVKNVIAHQTKLHLPDQCN